MESPSNAPPRSRRIWIAVLGCWLALVTFGAAKLVLYSATPGYGALRPSRSAGRHFRLYVFFHPLCPCSSASLTELSRLQAAAPSDLEIVTVIDGAGLPTSAGRALADRLLGVKGLAVELDADGDRTALFGARTSGQVLLYDKAGQLAFAGGVTASRAHAGDNLGETSILEILRGHRPDARHTPVYGCALSRPSVNP